MIQINIKHLGSSIDTIANNARAAMVKSLKITGYKAIRPELRSYAKTWGAGSWQPLHAISKYTRLNFRKGLAEYESQLTRYYVDENKLTLDVGVLSRKDFPPKVQGASEAFTQAIIRNTKGYRFTQDKIRYQMTVEQIWMHFKKKADNKANRNLQKALIKQIPKPGSLVVLKARPWALAVKQQRKAFFIDFFQKTFKEKMKGR